MNKKYKNYFTEDLEYEQYEYKNYILNKKKKIERQKERKIIIGKKAINIYGYFDIYRPKL